MIRELASAAGWGVAAARRLSSATLIGLAICLLRLVARGADGDAPSASAPIAAAIRGIVDAGQQPLLRRPDFRDRQDATRRLYDAVNFQPLWLRGGKPTSQAAEIIRTLSEADRRGLLPEDYDAARLREAAARFESAPPPAAADAAAFAVMPQLCQ